MTCLIANVGLGLFFFKIFFLPAQLVSSSNTQRATNRLQETTHSLAVLSAKKIKNKKDRSKN